MKHTPGPWKWAYGGLDDGKEPETREEFLEWCGEIWDKTDPRGGHLNCVYNDSETRVVAITGNGPCGEPNARLIAVAPELLAACAEFVRKVECGEARSVRSYAQMKAAIAKAEGPE